MLEDKNKYGSENIIVVMELNLNILEMAMDSTAVDQHRVKRRKEKIAGFRRKSVNVTSEFMKSWLNQNQLPTNIQCKIKCFSGIRRKKKGQNYFFLAHLCPLSAEWE